MMQGPRPYTAIYMATCNGRTYAVLGVNGANGNEVMTLVVSDDHLHTWRAIDGNLPAAAGGDPNYRGLWVNLATGAILVEPLGSLWSTADEGQHWTQVRAPTTGVVDYRVQQPVAGPWHICATYYTSSADSMETFACTEDGGQTWTQLPELALPGGTGSLQLLALLRDGSFLVSALVGGSTPTLYRLPAGAMRWQSLGTEPGQLDYPVFAPTRSGGEVWMVAGESDGAGGTGVANIVYAAAIGR